jgi:hypothetical protein
LMRGVKLERETVFAALVPVLRTAKPNAIARSEACIVRYWFPHVLKLCMCNLRLFRVVNERWFHGEPGC